MKVAAALELEGLAVLDIDGMYSAVQTAIAGKKHGVRIVHGTEITLGSLEFFETPIFTRGQNRGIPRVLEDMRLPILASSQVGYHALSTLLSTHFLASPGRRKARLQIAELQTLFRQWPSHGLLALTGSAQGPLRKAVKAFGLKAGRAVLEELKDLFGPDGVAVELVAAPAQPAELTHQLALLAKEADLPLVGTTAARLASPERHRLGDVLTATRFNKPLEVIESRLPALNSFLRSGKEMAALLPDHGEAIENAAHIADRFSFDLKLISPGLPHYDTSSGVSESEHLRKLTYEGAKQHYGSRAQSPLAWKLIDHELQIIDQLDFPGYFLIVKDIVDFCASRQILCQGRGSAANSAVCYALGITAVDAVRHKMLFERFLSPDRKEAPDIDLDIEAVRREEVIQYVYEKYGRENAAQVANVITYRPKSAVRDAGRALGFPEDLVHRWTKFTREGAGGAPETVLDLAAQMQKLPRHMGLHPGGMVITRRPVAQVCPVMWAAKEERSVLQWDKEDCADAGLVKFDLLGLGMLTALRKVYRWLEEEGVLFEDKPIGLHNMPAEDPRVYDLLCAAETVGVFQVESRAQMNTLPRLKPRSFYDIVVEVALIRPGPIQGRAVNPYLRRRNGLEPVSYIHPLLKPALEKTLGVPLFQEQLMQIAVDGAGFSPGEADQLRRAIGSKHSSERMGDLKPALFQGMTKNGIPLDAQEQIFEQLQGFAQFGFPESHAFSFAFLVYASAWLKVHYPEHFYAGILASQPMGFYSPASLIADAKRHGVRVLGPCVQRSQIETVPQLEGQSQRNIGKALIDVDSQRCVRLGLETIKGLGQAGKRIVEARNQTPFVDVEDLASRAQLTPKQLEKLSAAGALKDLGLSRREGLWVAQTHGQTNWFQPYLPGTEVAAELPNLPDMTAEETLLSDYETMGLTLGPHPMSTLRPKLSTQTVIELKHLISVPAGTIVRIAGVVTHRQRPSTAGGTTFLSLEDEGGLANVICPKGVWKRYRKVALESSAIIVSGRVERDQGSVAVLAHKLEKLVIHVPWKSRDFR